MIMSPMTYSGASWSITAKRPSALRSGAVVCAIVSTISVCWATEKACAPIVWPFQRATRARPWAMSSISMSSGEGSSRSSRRPDSMRCQARGGEGECLGIGRQNGPGSAPSLPIRRRRATECRFRVVRRSRSARSASRNAPTAARRGRPASRRQGSGRRRRSLPSPGRAGRGRRPTPSADEPSVPIGRPPAMIDATRRGKGRVPRAVTIRRRAVPRCSMRETTSWPT